MFSVKDIRKGRVYGCGLVIQLLIEKLVHLEQVLQTSEKTEARKAHWVKHVRFLMLYHERILTKGNSRSRHLEPRRGSTGLGTGGSSAQSIKVVAETMLREEACLAGGGPPAGFV